MNKCRSFRGKRKDLNIWVYGYYCKIGNKDNIMDSDACIHKVIPETVGRCICLKDIKENVLYEGDIIRFEYDEVFSSGRYEGLIYFEETFAVYYVDCGSVSLQLHELIENDFEIEIIGNSTDNSELLE